MPGRGGAASSAGDDAVEWSGAEQEQLEALMGQYPEGGHLAGPQRYIALAAQLPRKTARDVALRVRWTLQRDSLKKRDTGGKKVKHKSEREPRAQSIFSVGVWPTSAASQPASEPAGMSAAAAPLMGAVPAGGGAVQINTVQYAASIPQLEDHGADTIGNLGGQTAELLDQNLAIISQVRAHWAACRIHENSSQLLQLRDNLIKIVNGINNMPGIMTQMPPLPVKLNIELARHILQTR